MHGAKGMLESIVYRSRIYQVAQPKLSDSPQSLEGGVVDELKDKWMANGDKTIDWIIDDFSKGRHRLFF